MIIAEIAQAHDGSLGSAHAYIEALASTGVDAVKFQTHLAHAESSVHEPFRVLFSKQDATRMDYWRRMEFTLQQWKGLKQHCDDVGLEFLSSPFSNAAVDLLEEVGVHRYKLGSGEIGNSLLLRKVAQTGKPLLLSSGMSDFDELEHAVSFLEPYGNHVSVLQCTTAYPTIPEQWGLNILSELRSRFQLPIGFSDHSGDIYACLAAAALGAELFEFHVVFDKRQFGPDTPASITIDQTKQLVVGIKQIQTALAHPVDKTNNSSFSELIQIFGKSLAINKDLPKDHVLCFEDLEAKKPKGIGIDAVFFPTVIGRKLRHSMAQWNFLNEDDLV
jgi:N-acetylneuraminate synthase